MSFHDQKPITDLDPHKSAKELGLFVNSNGHVSWLEAAGRHYKTPRWLLNLIQRARQEGRDDLRGELRSLLGVRKKGDPELNEVDV